MRESEAVWANTGRRAWKKGWKIIYTELGPSSTDGTRPAGCPSTTVVKRRAFGGECSPGSLNNCCWKAVEREQLWQLTPGVCLQAPGRELGDHRDRAVAQVSMLMTKAGKQGEQASLRGFTHSLVRRHWPLSLLVTQGKTGGSWAQFTV